MEMRREVRYPLNTPVQFVWEDGRHEHLYGEGVTRDISLLGAFILTPICPPVDVPVEVEVVLPSPTGLKTAIRVTGEARVLRVERPSEGENGFALMSEDFSGWRMKASQRESAASFG